MSEAGRAGDEAAILTPYVKRFALVFTAFTVAAILITTWFEISGNSGLSIGILMASAVAAGQKFVGDHKRLMHKDEKRRLVLHCFVVSVLVSLVLFIALTLVLGEDPMFLINELLKTIPVWAMVAGVIFVAGVHIGVLYLALGFVLGKVFEGMKKRGEV